MFKKKLLALNYQKFSEDFTEENAFRSLVIWLEDTKIRHYAVEDRKSLRDTSSSSWSLTFETYLKDLCCPVGAQDRNAVIDYLLGLAVRLEYGDNVDKYKQKALSMKQSGVNPLEKLDYNEESFINGVSSVAKLLQIPPHPDHLIVLKAISILVKNKFSKEALAILKRDGIKPIKSISLDKIELGFETKDYITQDVSKMLRLLHIQQMRQLQDIANQAIVSVQKIIANPKTDTKLGKVGIM